MKSNKRKVQLFFISAVTLGLFLVGGCATNGTLSAEKISAGDKAINDAKISNASLNAPAELNIAEKKLSEARDALAKQDYESANRLAEQAQVDADYARAKATTTKARKTAEEMQQNIQTLRQEIDRLSKQ